MRENQPRRSVARSIHHRRRGFSLIELLVVIGIMALMAGITVLAVAPMMEGRRVSSGARIVQAMLYRARMYAAVNRRPASVWFYPGEGKVASYNGIPDPGDEVQKKDRRIQEPGFLPAGVSFRRYTQNGWVIVDPAENPVGNMLVFGMTGGVDVPATNSAPWAEGSDHLGQAENPRVMLQGEEEGTFKVIEVVFTTGLTRIYDQ